MVWLHGKEERVRTAEPGTCAAPDRCLLSRAVTAAPPCGCHAPNNSQGHVPFLWGQRHCGGIVGELQPAVSHKALSAPYLCCCSSSVQLTESVLDGK